jgi:hypothetical protein
MILTPCTARAHGARPDAGQQQKYAEPALSSGTLLTKPLTDKHQGRRRNRRNQKRPKEQHLPVYFWDIVGLRLMLGHDVHPLRALRRSVQVAMWPFGSPNGRAPATVLRTSAQGR